MKLKNAVMVLTLMLAGISYAQAISITVQPADVVCAVSVTGTATNGATAVSIYIVQNGEETTLVVNDSIGTDGSYNWTGIVPDLTTLDNATVKAVTNRQTTATAGINGSCTASN